MLDAGYGLAQRGFMPKEAHEFARGGQNTAYAGARRPDRSARSHSGDAVMPIHLGSQLQRAKPDRRPATRRAAATRHIRAHEASLHVFQAMRTQQVVHEKSWHSAAADE
jgi:hypothetical protein